MPTQPNQCASVTNETITDEGEHQASGAGILR